MKYINLGKSGLKVSKICLGIMSYGDPSWRPWVLTEEQGRPFIKRALELGINFFDTADMYSTGASEEILGRAMKDFAKREDVVAATKVFFPMGQSPNRGGLSRKHIMHSIDASLKRLQMDYIDLYQIHRFDPETPLEETLETLNDLVRAGKVRYIGASSMYAWQFLKALHLSECHGWTQFISMQNHYNLLYREEEREMIPLCQSEGVGIIPWSPLARGLLTGSTNLRSKTDEHKALLYTHHNDLMVVDAVAQIAEQKERSRAQIALAWLLNQPAVTAPIVGATKMHHLEEAVAALDIILSSQDRKILEEHYVPHAVLGHS